MQLREALYLRKGQRSFNYYPTVRTGHPSTRVCQINIAISSNPIQSLLNWPIHREIALRGPSREGFLNRRELHIPTPLTAAQPINSTASSPPKCGNTRGRSRAVCSRPFFSSLLLLYRPSIFLALRLQATNMAIPFRCM